MQAVDEEMSGKIRQFECLPETLFAGHSTKGLQIHTAVWVRFWIHFASPLPPGVPQLGKSVPYLRQRLTLDNAGSEERTTSEATVFSRRVAARSAPRPSPRFNAPGNKKQLGYGTRPSNGRPSASSPILFIKSVKRESRRARSQSGIMK